LEAAQAAVVILLVLTEAVVAAAVLFKELLLLHLALLIPLLLVLVVAVELTQVALTAVTQHLVFWQLQKAVAVARARAQQLLLRVLMVVAAAAVGVVVHPTAQAAVVVQAVQPVLCLATILLLFRWAEKVLKAVLAVLHSR
jgi:hypothetical protein